MIPRSGSRRDTGFAMIVTLGFTVILAFMALAMSSTARLNSAAFQNNADLLRARTIAEAAIELGKLDLSRGENGSSLRLDGTPHRFAIDNGWATVTITDERAKLDLNHQPLEHLAGLIDQIARAAGEHNVSGKSLAAEIKQLRPASSIDIRAIPSVSQRLFAGLDPHITVLGYGAAVNVMRADEPVLRALSGVTPALLQAIRIARESGGPRPSLGLADAFATDQSGPAFTITGTGRVRSGIEVRITALVLTTGMGIATNRIGVRVVEQR